MKTTTQTAVCPCACSLLETVSIGGLLWAACASCGTVHTHVALPRWNHQGLWRTHLEMHEAVRPWR